MGITAENVAKQFSITREQQDAFAYGSQQKAKKALEANVFADEIVTVSGVRYADGAKHLFDFNRDELPRTDTTLEGLGSLRPAFARKGSVTAGNSSPLSDGAAATMVMTEAKAEELGVTPLGLSLIHI